MTTSKFEPAFEPIEDDCTLSRELVNAQSLSLAKHTGIIAYYLSRDRVLSLLDFDKLSGPILGALQGQDITMSSAILSNMVGTHIIDAIRAGGISTLHELEFREELKVGVPFIYHGHVSGSGFAFSNTAPGRSLTEKLTAPLDGKKMVVEFSRGGLLNDTASTRLSGSVANIFIFGYITAIEGDCIRAAPYVIGDLVDKNQALSPFFVPSIELRPEKIAQFAGVDSDWMPSKTEFNRMRQVPERNVKELICRLLGEHDVPKDWGGEECDLFSAYLIVEGERQTGAFLLKGPSCFHPMQPTDLGKNGDQIYRLFNIPAQVYVVQHCHRIGAAVRKQAEAFALARALVAPCRLVFIDGLATARLLRTHGSWPAVSS